jgi:hypothetical protein
VTTAASVGLVRAEPARFSGAFDGERIVTDPPPDSLGQIVMDGGVAVVKGVFGSEADELLALRRQVFEWGRATPPTSAAVPDVNGHSRMAGVSARQKTPHVYHSYDLDRISQLPKRLGAHLRRYYEPLADFQNALTGNSGRLEAFGDGPTLRPQLIQYPPGGGLFGRHVHPLEPQRIGMIVALSRRGVDFAHGGACFAHMGSLIDIEPFHDIGDIALFRFDIPHWVSPSDLGEKFDWDSEAGRWSMVLPYN